MVAPPTRLNFYGCIIMRTHPWLLHHHVKILLHDAYRSNIVTTVATLPTGIMMFPYLSSYTGNNLY